MATIYRPSGPNSYAAASTSPKRPGHFWGNFGLGCYAKAARESGSVDPQCLAENLAELAEGAKSCYERAIALGDCSNASAAPAARGVADDFVARALCTLDPPPGD
jgi:hypothetical protein